MLWEHIDAAVQQFVENGDLIEKIDRRYIVGYITKELRDAPPETQLVGRSLTCLSRPPGTNRSAIVESTSTVKAGFDVSLVRSSVTLSG
jgi:hypothetical protein